MDKQQILSRLKPLVGNNRHWEAFNNYLDEIIETQHRALEQAEDNVMMYRAQGAIAVLRRLKQLRDEVVGND